MKQEPFHTDVVADECTAVLLESNQMSCVENFGMFQLDMHHVQLRPFGIVLFGIVPCGCGLSRYSTGDVRPKP